MPRQISEDLTRKEIIDPHLQKAAWYLRDHSRVKIEIPVDGYDAEPWNGVSDYCLYRENGEVLGVVEAKRVLVDVRLAQAQLEYYVTEIEKHQSYKQAKNMVSGSAAPHVTVQDIKNFIPIIPPLSLQEEFAGVVRRVEGLRGKMSEAGRQVEGLFESLLAEAFHG
jgi:type I site-specific restriction endonuclease